MHNHFKTQKFKHLMLAMGPRDLNSAPYSPVHCSSHSRTSFQSSELTELPVVENSQLFAQHAHSARYAPHVYGRRAPRLNHGRSQILDAPAQAIPANVPGVVHNQLLCYIQSLRHSLICTRASDMPLPGSGCTLGGHLEVMSPSDRQLDLWYTSRSPAGISFLYWEG